MRGIWSEGHKHRLWHRVWVALAAAQPQASLIDEDQLADLTAHQNEIDLARAAKIEAEIQNSVDHAEIRRHASAIGFLEAKSTA